MDTDDETGRREYLQTRYVFVDTSAYVSSALDWTGQRLTRLAELGAAGTIRLLTTEVTRHEVRRKIEERVDEALKHLRTLAHAGLNTGPCEDRERAVETACGSFENFLYSAGVEVIPLQANLAELVEDYFASRPPFSSKKRNEWRDAIVCKSLLAHVDELSRFTLDDRYKIYVVASDPDFGAVCATCPDLIRAESVAEIISRGTVSIEVYEHVRRSINAHPLLRTMIEKKLVGRDAKLLAKGYAPRTGKIRTCRVDALEDVFIIDHQGPNFDCEVLTQIALDVTFDNFDEDADPRAWYPSSQRAQGITVLHVTVKNGTTAAEPLLIRGVYAGDVTVDAIRIPGLGVFS